MFKVLNRIVPAGHFKFYHNRIMRATNTRQNENLSVPRAHTNIGGQSFLIKGPVIWNAIPSAIRTTRNLSTFKELLLKQILHGRPSN